MIFTSFLLTLWKETTKNGWSYGQLLINDIMYFCSQSQALVQAVNSGYSWFGVLCLRIACLC